MVLSQVYMFIKCVVEGQRAESCNSGLCGFICTTYLIRRVISCGFYVNFSQRLFQTTGIPTVMERRGIVMGRRGQKQMVIEF